MTSWHGYPKVYNLGHAYLSELLFDDVLVEEKIDGSQFSFGKFGGELKCRSSGREFQPDEADNMFQPAVEVVKTLDLQNGFTYRSEYLQKPKHNTLSYGRIPKNHLILFDVNTAEERYLSYDGKESEANRLGLECVPKIHFGSVDKVEDIQGFLKRESVLGNVQIEGVVIKNYGRFGKDGKSLMGKFVSEAFKETHAGDWKERNPKGGDILLALADTYRSQARWEKAVNRLRDNGLLKNSLEDIGLLIREIPKDILAECEEAIKGKLFEWAWEKIGRSVTRGFPEWYKERLLKAQFDRSEAVK